MCPFREGDESRRPTQFLRERFTGCFRSRTPCAHRPRRRAPEGGDESFSLGGGPSRMKRSVIRRDGEKPDLRADWRRLRYAALFIGACVLVVVLLGVVGLYH